MSSELVTKLKGVRDLKKILETTVKDLGDTFNAATCQVMLSNPLDPNVTSICEYKNEFADEGPVMPSATMPLVLHGRTFGALSLSRLTEIKQEEVNAMRVILGELGDIIRHAQINDIVQRDTFRDTFLVEIGNVMAYSLGIGDALFMVVNILGKVLQTSRCLFICTDDTQAGWKVYEFWQQDKVQSCQEFRWPTTDSPLIAQTLLSTAPLKVYEGQQNSYVSPVQEELQFIGVRSLLGVPLKSSQATHGCVILQQCDYRRAWTRNEIDMVQNVADKVAEALAKLPAEKRAREPIMQLHQRTIDVPPPANDGREKIQNVRKALKGALGLQAIPTANKTGFVPPPPKPIVAPPPKPAPAAPLAPPATAAPTTPAAPASAGAGASPTTPPTVSAPGSKAPLAPGAVPPGIASSGAVSPAAATAAAGSAAVAPASTTNQAPGTVQSSGTPAQVAGATPGVAPSGATPLDAVASATGNAAAPGAGAPTISPVQSKAQQAKSLGNILSNQAAASAPAGVPEAPKAGDPYADLDFGDFGDVGGARPKTESPETTWNNLEAIQPAAGQALTTSDASAQMPGVADGAELSSSATGELPIFEPSNSLSAALAGAAAEIGDAGAAPSAAAASADVAPPAAAAPAPPVESATSPGAAPVADQPASPWGDLDSIGSFGAAASNSSVESPSVAGTTNGGAATAPTSAQSPAAEASPWGDLDAIGGGASAPAASTTAAPSGGPWGDLDSIQAPTSPPVRAGLGGVMLGKARANTASKGPLKSSFRKPEAAEEAPPTFVEGPAIQIDEAAAQAKIQSLVSSSSTETSDYIFASPGLDMRMLGRIDGWVNQIEQKDKYVNGHARQVAEYAIAIARECGMSEDEVNTIRLASLVHDVGKLGSAASILQKPDEQLSDPELITMMKHPLDGAELLESFPDLQKLAPIVRGHHEEFDGNGYPQGLKGEEIPPEARIINVANSYFSLISKMRYGDGISPMEAQNQMVQGAGKQWDPKYVQALIQAILSKKVPASL